MSLAQRKTVRLVFVPCLLALGVVLPCVAADTELIERGRNRYLDDCAGCHGSTARGDGSVAETLTIRPTDLTVLSKDNREIFPEDYVRRAVDGRDLPPAAHGQVAMPVWGRHYQRSMPAYSEQIVQEKIDALVAYLRSIQRE